MLGWEARKKERKKNRRKMRQGMKIQFFPISLPLRSIVASSVQALLHQSHQNYHPAPAFLWYLQPTTSKNNSYPLLSHQVRWALIRTVCPPQLKGIFEALHSEFLQRSCCKARMIQCFFHDKRFHFPISFSIFFIIKICLTIHVWLLWNHSYSDLLRLKLPSWRVHLCRNQAA